jgi:hypothetical protein
VSDSPQAFVGMTGARHRVWDRAAYAGRVLIILIFAGGGFFFHSASNDARYLPFEMPPEEMAQTRPGRPPPPGAANELIGPPPPTNYGAEQATLMMDIAAFSGLIAVWNIAGLWFGRAK